MRRVGGGLGVGAKARKHGVCLAEVTAVTREEER